MGVQPIAISSFYACPQSVSAAMPVRKRTHLMNISAADRLLATVVASDANDLLTTFSDLDFIHFAYITEIELQFRPINPSISWISTANEPRPAD